MKKNADEQGNQRVRLNLANGRLAGPVLVQLPPSSRFEEDYAAEVYI